MIFVQSVSLFTNRFHGSQKYDVDVIANIVETGKR